MTDQADYKGDLDVLLALVTHLALVPKKSRTPKWLATDLGLGHDRVKLVLGRYPGLFRKSKKLSKEGAEPFYTVHARYALRPKPGTEEDEREDLEQLHAEHLTVLVEFLTRSAERQSAEDLALQHIEHTAKVAQDASRQSAKSARVAAGAAVVGPLLVALFHFFTR